MLIVISCGEVVLIVTFPALSPVGVPSVTLYCSPIVRPGAVYVQGSALSVPEYTVLLSEVFVIVSGTETLLGVPVQLILTVKSCVVGSGCPPV